MSRFPNWVEYSFLAKPFFEKCERHDDMVKSELNRYCISCDESVCRYCIVTGPHHDHNILTIYRHVYQNVVPLSQMENHMDCHRIQVIHHSLISIHLTSYLIILLIIIMSFIIYVNDDDNAYICYVSYIYIYILGSC